jgi:hypothetical protein
MAGFVALGSFLIAGFAVVAGTDAKSARKKIAARLCFRGVLLIDISFNTANLRDGREGG